MSTHREIEEAYKSDIAEKIKMIKGGGSPIDDIGTERDGAWGNVYEDKEDLKNSMAEFDKGREGARQVFKRKSELVAMKGGCCENCGYNRTLSALDFHHPDPKTKSFTMRYAMRYWGEQRYRKSLIPHVMKKTMLLCANCHREKHWAKRKLDKPTVK